MSSEIRGGTASHNQGKPATLTHSRSSTSSPSSSPELCVHWQHHSSTALIIFLGLTWLRRAVTCGVCEVDPRADTCEETVLNLKLKTSLYLG